VSRAPRILFMDGTAGASGDMILGALVDVGVPLAALRRGLAGLPLPAWSLSSTKVERDGLAVRRVRVRLREAPAPHHDLVGAPGAHGHTHRTLRDLERIVRAGKLPGRVRDRALAIFRRLVEAEGQVHGIPPEKVHLHEVGATDAVVDVVGACLALEALALDRLVVSPLTTGHGTVQCAHGLLPVPAPATALLLRGVPIQAGEPAGERLTPTGAAILTTLADAWGPMPAMVPHAIGYGAGERTFHPGPNALRAVLGDGQAQAGAHGGEHVLVLQANVDDATPQALAFACERLLETGALEVYTEAVLMKKGRAGHKLTVLARPDDLDRLADVLLRETTTLGLRHRLERRIELTRTLVAVPTPHGKIRVKVGTREGEVLQAWPEYEDCAAAARRAGVPLRRVQAAALDAWRGLRARKR
jgi:uncharacterized protein (TIGR00299 family) protein